MKSICTVICIILLGTGCPWAASHKSILIIQSYHEGLVWTEQCEEGIRSVLGPDYGIRKFYMDTKRITEAMYPERADEAWQAFVDIRPDLLMIGDDNGLRLLAPRLETVDTPVVYFGINHNPRTYFSGRHPANVTGILERLPVFPWLRYLKQVMPRAEKAMVLMDDSPTSHAIVRRTFQGRQRIQFAGTQVSYRMAMDWSDWMALVTGADTDLIVMPTFHAVKRKAGTTVDYMEVVTWTSAHAGVPLFSLQDYVVGAEGAAGAYTVFGLSHGAMAGDLARQILDEGKTPGQLPPRTDEQGQFFFNRLQLERYGLTLPPGIEAQARFR